MEPEIIMISEISQEMRDDYWMGDNYSTASGIQIQATYELGKNKEANCKTYKNFGDYLWEGGGEGCRTLVVSVVCNCTLLSNSLATYY